MASWNVAVAQVGHDPAASPFQDIRRGGGPMFRIGFLGGERGDVGVGQSSGVTYGLRYEAAVGGPTVLTAGFAYALTDRFAVDPLKDSLTRKSGPYADDLLLADVGLQFQLTGAKTWHGIAPYLGAAVGLAVSNGYPTADSSGYRFGTKFTIAPGAGVRWYPIRRLTVSADLRAIFWKLRYPASFRVPSPVDSSRVLRLNAPDADWTTHPWISIGVGWIF
ncbi:MAG: hypothetical protein HYS40_06110 [Gemmatimonadetes bacterium]|nr:hypothetical protein [Gemmatimonadota bacterium]